MKNVTLLILEKRKSYGERLAAFLGRQAYSPFNIQLYLEHPISDEKWKKADLVLITSSLMALYGEKVKEGNVCILDESGQIIGMEGRNVYKYQSAGVIYQRLLEFCEENGWMLQGERNHGKKECVCAGIYRPVNNEKSFLKVLEMDFSSLKRLYEVFYFIFSHYMLKQKLFYIYHFQYLLSNNSK